jgi:hypothetical protein
MGTRRNRVIRTILMLVVLFAAAGAFATFAVDFLMTGVDAIDDAYISFRYARNLAEGHGLVYNPGEEPVQGYTNFLWVLLIALALAIGLPPVGTACVLGFTAGLAALVLTAAWSCRRLAPGQAAAAVAPALLVANIGFVVWSLRGLETGLFTLLVLAAGLTYLRRPAEAGLSHWSAALFVLATLCRPEGVLAFGLTVVHLLISRWREGAPLLRREDLAALTVFVGGVGLYGGWAAWYYGDPLPNTFHAKVGGPLDSLPRGGRYLWNFARYGTGWPLLLLPLTLLERTRLDGTRSYAFVMAAGFAAYIALVGGDVFPAYRFLVPALPFLYLLVGDGLAALEDAMTRTVTARTPASIPGLRRWGRPAIPAVAVAALLAVLVLATHRPSSAFARREWNRGNAYTGELRMVGRWLRREMPPGTWIALNPAGALPYESRLPAIDMLGLNDREIARTPVKRLGRGRLAGHEKGNGRSVFDRRPEIILIGGVKLDWPPALREWTPHSRSERELSQLPGLYQVYRIESHRMEDGRILTFLRLRNPSHRRPDSKP